MFCVLCVLCMRNRSIFDILSQMELSRTSCSRITYTLMGQNIKILYYSPQCLKFLIYLSLFPSTQWQNLRAGGMWLRKCTGYECKHFPRSFASYQPRKFCLNYDGKYNHSYIATAICYRPVTICSQ